MADFFEKHEEVTEPQPEVQEPQKVKVGEDEYSQEELAQLVGLGKIGREAEEKFHTKIDKVWPEYTKAQQKLREYEAVNQKPAEPQVKVNEDEVVKQARQEAKRLGIALDDEIEDRVTKKIMQVLEAKDLLDQCKSLEGEIDGSDGRPKFSTDAILAHMQSTGIKNPEKAYKDMHESEIDRWKEEQIAKAKPKGMVTEPTSTAGSKQPPEIKVDRNNFEAMVRDALEKKI